MAAPVVGVLERTVTYAILSPCARYLSVYRCVIPGASYSVQPGNATATMFEKKKKKKKKERQTDRRQTDRQTDRQTEDRQRKRETETERQTDSVLVKCIIFAQM